MTKITRKLAYNSNTAEKIFVFVNNDKYGKYLDLGNLESCAIMTILKLIKIFIIKMFCLKILFNTNRNIFTFYYNRIVKFNFFIVILVLKIFSNKFFYRNINKYTLNIRTHKTIYIYFIIAYKPHKMSNLDH